MFLCKFLLALLLLLLPLLFLHFPEVFIGYPDEQSRTGHTRLVHQPPEIPAWAVQQIVRMAELHQPAGVHHQHPIAIHDRVQPMGDR